MLDTWDHCDNLWLFGEFFADQKYCPDQPPDRKFGQPTTASPPGAISGHAAGALAVAAVAGGTGVARGGNAGEGISCLSDENE
jgi:hypothetical protein